MHWRFKWILIKIPYINIFLLHQNGSLDINIYTIYTLNTPSEWSGSFMVIHLQDRVGITHFTSFTLPVGWYVNEVGIYAAWGEWKMYGTMSWKREKTGCMLHATYFMIFIHMYIRICSLNGERELFVWLKEKDIERMRIKTSEEIQQNIGWKRIQEKIEVVVGKRERNAASLHVCVCSRALSCKSVRCCRRAAWLLM